MRGSELRCCRYHGSFLIPRTNPKQNSTLGKSAPKTSIDVMLQ